MADRVQGTMFFLPQVVAEAIHKDAADTGTSASVALLYRLAGAGMDERGGINMDCLEAAISAHESERAGKGTFPVEAG